MSSFTTTLFALLVMVMLSSVLSSPATITRGTMRRGWSSVAPGNILPQFLFMQGEVEGGVIAQPTGGGRGSPVPFVPDDDCTDDIFLNANPDLRSPQLPYNTQDQWGCQNVPTDVDILYLEDDKLQVRIVPGVGGKVWGITDKVNQREMLFDNPSHQPANIATLHAWGSGGSEWNYSPGIIGHSAFTETTTWTGILNTSRGPVVRVYNMDRYNHTTWSVDMFLENGTFWAHPRIVNTNPVDLQGYWWTCVAHHVTPKSRVVTPAASVVQTSSVGTQCNEWPYFASYLQNDSFTGLNHSYGVDNSWVGNAYNHADFFFRIQSPIRPYVAHVEEDGYTVIHGHPLNGTKYFTWGENGPGRYMQDFLSGYPSNRAGDYIELQIGPAPTQMNTFPLPANQDYTWTEWFHAYKGDTAKLHSPTYSDAVAEVTSHYKDQSVVSDMNAFFASIAHTDVTTIVTQGPMWGGLEEARRGKRLAPGLSFPLTADRDTQPWIELLQNGSFSAQTLSLLPTSYLVHDAWYTMLQNSVSTKNNNYLAYLHLAVNHIERGDVNISINLLQHARQLMPHHPVVLRCLAVLQPTQDDALLFYWMAMDAALSPTSVFASDTELPQLVMNLATEMYAMFIANRWWDQAQKLNATLTAQGPRFQIALRTDFALVATISVNVYAVNTVESVDVAIQSLSTECFPTLAATRGIIQTLWLDAVVARATLKAGRPLNQIEQHDVRVANPIPRNIGCTYGATYCENYW